MSEPTGLIGFFSLSKEDFERFLQADGGKLAARAFEAARRYPGTVFAFRYVPKRRGVLVFACDEAKRPESWAESPAFELCRLLAAGEGGEGIVLVSSGILNYRVDPIARAWSIGPNGLQPLAPAPGWDDPRLVLLDELLATIVFPAMEKADEPERAATALVDAAVRKLARTEGRRRLEAEKTAAIDAARKAAAAGGRIKPITLARGILLDGRAVRWCTGAVLEDADPYTIRALPQDVAADKNHVWRHGRRVPGALGAGFKVLGGVDGIYATDGLHVFVSEGAGFRIIEEADPKTFEDLDFAFARDARHIYNRGKILEGVGEKYSINRCGFLCGERAVYHYDFRLPLDPATFEVLDMEQKLKDTNPFWGEFRLKDKSGIYRYDSWKKTLDKEN